MDTQEEKENDKTPLVVEGKGICQECRFYTDCPRMKGINQCYTVRRENEDKGTKPKQ